MVTSCMAQAAVIQAGEDKIFLHLLIKKRSAGYPPCPPGGGVVNGLACCPAGCGGGIIYNGIASPTLYNINLPAGLGDVGYTCATYCFSCYATYASCVASCNTTCGSGGCLPSYPCHT